jgi:ABC-type phosphate/phosphonate transport system substrate-binding protein
MVDVIWKIIKGVAHLLLFLICCAPVRAEDTGHRGSHDEIKPLVVGYSPLIFYNINPRDAIGLTKVWFQLVDRKLKFSGETSVVLFKDIKDAESALAKNEVDIIVLISEEFLTLRETVPLLPVLTADYGKNFYDELLLLVRDDSGITRVGQLRNRSLRIESGQKGSIPKQWLDTLLLARGSSDSRVFFSSIIDHPKASQAILPVFFGQADACIAALNSFETLAELNPQLGRHLRILEKSPGFATGIIAVRKDVQNKRRDAMIEAIMEMHTDPKGKQLLTLFRINRLVPFRAEHLTAVEKVIREHRGRSDSVARRKQ